MRDVENPATCPTGIVWRRTDLLRHLSRLNTTRSYGYYNILRVCWLRPSEPDIEHCEAPGPQENVRFLCRVFSSGRPHWSPFEDTEGDGLERCVSADNVTASTTEGTTPRLMNATQPMNTTQPDSSVSTGSTGDATSSPLETEIEMYTLDNGKLSVHPHDCLFGVVVSLRELDSLAPKLPNVVSFIMENQVCVYDTTVRLTLCRESAVRRLNAPYVCRT